ncbi:MAG: hypothetical protein JWO19_4163 [Bryobacterales bacterium]|nr:hypothetical protein [Bryobacterales bacterium]
MTVDSHYPAQVGGLVRPIALDNPNSMNQMKRRGLAGW